jgi:hypothetical protein
MRYLEGWMKRLHSLLILLVLTVLLSIWEQGHRWNIISITYALFIAFIIEIIAIFLEVRSTYIRFSPKKIIFQLKNRLNKYLIRRRLSIRYENEKEKEFFEDMINIAITSLKSDDPEKKRTGLIQLHAIEPQVDQTKKILIYDKLLDVMHDEKDKIFRNILQESICEFFKICRDFL